MAGSGGVPSRHAVAVKVAVVLLQLLQGIKCHKAVMAFLLNAQEVVLPASMLQGQLCMAGSFQLLKAMSRLRSPTT